MQTAESADRRVVVTGLGIVSSVGLRYADAIDNILAARSGVEAVPAWRDLALSSAVAGTLHGVDEKKRNAGIPKKKLAYASAAAVYCVLAANDAVCESGVPAEQLASPRSACIVGSGVSGVQAIYSGGTKIFSGKLNRVSPYTVVHAMSSSCSASVANTFGVLGRSYSISSACATSTHNIGHAYELIRSNAIDTAIAGGGEELNELITGAFCSMRMALSTHFNDRPEAASRPYDRDRDGFVISGGGGIVILEDLETARRRGAPILAEILSFAANSDGSDIILPEPEGRQTAVCMRQALDAAGVATCDVDYVNTHGTSTVDGDRAEVRAMRRVFGDAFPAFSSTKSMTGHAVGAAGVNELIYCIGMLDRQAIAPSINVDNLDSEFIDLPLVTETREARLNVIMKNSFGFGGTNAVVVIGKYDG